MRALVTGCAGFIGSHLMDALLADGNAVLGIDCFNDNYGRREKLQNIRHSLDWDQFEFIPVDLATGDLREIVSEVDVIFHLAAEPGVRASWGQRFDSYLRNNVLATQRLLEATKGSPGKRFVYASSSSIYGDAEQLPTHESALPQPQSPYGTTKLAGEHLCRLYHSNYGVDAVMLRYFSVYGPRQRPDMAFNKFVRAVLRGEPVVVFGDGSQTRDFTYVGDVVGATRAAAAAPSASGSVYNIGGGARVSLTTVLELLQEFAHTEIEVRYESNQHGDVRHTCADTRLAQQELGFRAQTEFASGLRTQFQWARDIEGSSARASAALPTSR